MALGDAGDQDCTPATAVERTNHVFMHKPRLSYSRKAVKQPRHVPKNPFVGIFNLPYVGTCFLAIWKLIFFTRGLYLFLEDASSVAHLFERFRERLALSFVRSRAEACFPPKAAFVA